MWRRVGDMKKRKDEEGGKRLEKGGGKRKREVNEERNRQRSLTWLSKQSLLRERRESSALIPSGKNTTIYGSTRVLSRACLLQY